MKNPLVPVLAAISAGIVAAHFIDFEAWELFVAVALLLPLAIAAKRSRMFALGSLLFFSGALIAALHRPSPPPQIDAGSRETVTLSGCVVEPPAFYDGRDQFTLELAPKARARVTLAIKEGDLPPDLHYGQRVEFEARIRAIRNFQNPGAFDSQGFLARSGIYWTASVSAGNAVTIQAGECGSRFYSMVFALRTAILDRIDRLYRNNPYATGIMEATLIGEKRKLEKIWTDHFRRTGTYHMLVIDGLHVSVLAAVLLFLLRVCFVPQLAALSATAGFAWLYALLSGMDAPAVRAAGGFTCYLIARYFYRRARILNLLAAIAIVYLIYDPDQLFEAGFQLSFLCVAAIGAFALPSLEATSAPLVRGLHGINEVSRDPRLPPRVAHFRLELRLIAETFFYLIRIPQNWIAHFLSFVARLVFFAWEMAVISTVIQIALALPMAIYFHRIPLTGVSANIIVVPLLSLVIPIGFFAVFTNWSFAAAIAEWLLNTGETVADWHTGWEPNWRVADPPWWLSIAFSIALLGLAMAIPRSRRFTVAASLTVAALFALVFWQPFVPNTQPGILELTAIDVGQGDSLLVSFPNGKLMLVDGGGVLTFGRQSRPRLDIGEDVVSPYLWSRSIRRLDVITLTHAHDDHAAGLPALIENFHPAELWTGATPMSDIWSTIAAKARDRRVPIVPMHAGRNFDFGGARIEILSPPADYIPAAGPKNNDSLAMRITYGERSILLTGDMEKPMEIGLLADSVSVRADILKVGHHGSNTSSIDLFLDAVSPTYALISDGFENSFRHPHPQVLARLAAHKAGILRTDRQGLITVRTDGHRMWTETYLPRQASHQPYPHALGLLP